MKELYIVLILIIIFTFYGIFNFLAFIFKIPRYNNEILFKKKKNRKSNTDNYSHITHKIAEKIKLPKFIKLRLEEKIKLADINTTPELYVSNLISKSLTYFIFAIIVIPIHTFISILFIFMGFQTIIKGYKSIDDDIKIKTEKIEKEIPKFLDFMVNSFRFNKNVKEAFVSYEKIAGEYFKNNINITIADMTTGNYEIALKRLDTRINSYSFSKVVRAIIQVVRGEENTQYLTNLYRESASEEYERLKKDANKKIDKVARYSKVLLFCIVLMVFTMLAMVLFKDFSSIGSYM